MFNRVFNGASEPAQRPPQLDGSSRRRCFVPGTIRILTLAAFACILFVGCSPERKVEKTLERADRHYDAGEFEQAAIEYLNVIRADTNQTVAVSRLADIYFDRGEYSRAVPFLVEMERREPDNLDVRRKIGLLALQSRQLDKAREEALAILDRDEGVGDAITLLADASVTEDQVRSAIERIRAIDSAEVAGPVNLALGGLLLKSREFGEAEERLRGVAELSPRFAAAAASKLGQLYWAQNRLEQARTELERARDLAPENPLLFTGLADFLSRTGSAAEAESVLADCLDRFPEYLPARLKLAEVQAGMKKHEDALENLAMLLEKKVQIPEPWLLRAQIYIDQNEPDLAIQDLETLQARDQQSPELFYYLGIARLRKGQPALAADSLARAVALKPDFINAILLLAEVNLRRGETAAAVTALAPLAESRPDLGRAHQLLATAYLAMGAGDQAVLVYQALIDAAPEAIEPRHLLGLTLLQLKRQEQARTAFQGALDLSENFLPALKQLLEMDLKAEDHAAALARIQAQISRTPDVPEPWYLLAQVQLAANQMEQVEESLRQCLAVDPAYGPAYLALARYYQVAGKMDEALARIDELLERDPNNTGVLMQRAMILEQTNEVDRARSVYERILELNPEFGPALNNLAYLHAEKLNRLDEARELAARAHNLAPTNPHAADTLGWILFRQEQYQEALPLIQTAADGLPAHPEVQYHLGMAHFQMGQRQLAQVAFQRALELGGDAFVGRDEVVEKLAMLSGSSAGDDPSRPPSLAELEQRARDFPRDLVTLIDLGEQYRAAGDALKAEATFRSALEVNPRAVPALLGLAEVYIDPLNRPRDGLDLARKARSIDSSDARIGHAAGWLGYRAGDVDWAFGLLNEASGRLPDEPLVRYHYALTQIALGRLDDARTSLKAVAARTAAGFEQIDEVQRLLTLLDAIASASRRDTNIDADSSAPNGDAESIAEGADPSGRLAPLLEALVSERIGDTAGARSKLEDLRERFPRFAPAGKHLARVLTDHFEEDETARRLAMEARRDDPTDPDVAVTMGKLALRRGDLDYAVQLFTEAVRGLPKEPEPRLHLGRAYQARNQRTQAVDALNKAVELGPESQTAKAAKQLLRDLEAE